MFSGMNEILLIAAIVLALIFIPRLNTSRKTKTAGPGVPSWAKSGIRLSNRQRLAILLSIFWLAFWTVHYEPWHREWKLFIYIGAGPILVTWGLWWALKGRCSR